MSSTGDPLAGSTRVPLPGGVWPAGEDGGAPIREIALRAVSAEDEIALLETAALPPAERATLLLARCLADGERLAPVLTVGDREAALLHVRRLTIGDAIDAVLTCPSPPCGARLEVELRIADLLVEPYRDVRRVHEVTAGAPDGDYAVAFRLPAAADLRDVAAIARDHPQRAADAILERCVLRAERDGDAIPAPALPAEIRSAVGAAMADRDPQAELDLQLRCPACDATLSVVFDAASFFLRELDERASRLLKDVHLLAWHYHWSERDILQMPAWRRARYLQLLADAGRGRAA